MKNIDTMNNCLRIGTNSGDNDNTINTLLNTMQTNNGTQYSSPYSVNVWPSTETIKKSSIVELYLKDGTRIIRKLSFDDIQEIIETTDNNGDVFSTIVFIDKSEPKIEVTCSASTIMNMLGIEYNRFAEYNINNKLLNGE